MPQYIEMESLPRRDGEYAYRIRQRPRDARYLIYLLWNGRVDNEGYVRLYTQVCEAWWAIKDRDDRKDTVVPEETLDALRAVLPVIGEMAVEFSKDGHLEKAEHLAGTIGLITYILHSLDPGEESEEEERCSHGCASWSGSCRWTAGTACTPAS